MESNLDPQVRRWGMLCHLSALVGILLPLIGLPIPFANLLAPLIVWLSQKDKHPFIDAQGKESLNFQVSVTIYGFVSGIILSVLLIFYLISSGVLANTSSSSAQITALFGAGIWFIGLIVLVSVVTFVLVVIAAVKAANGGFYRYPFTIRLLR